MNWNNFAEWILLKQKKERGVSNNKLISENQELVKLEHKCE